jgi:hypothetical protein
LVSSVEMARRVYFLNVNVGNPNLIGMRQKDIISLCEEKMEMFLHNTSNLALCFNESRAKFVQHFRFTNEYWCGRNVPVTESPPSAVKVFVK